MTNYISRLETKNKKQKIKTKLARAVSLNTIV